MADLQARIGRKVFPNKSWTRPGYERPAQVKSSPNHHNSWKNNRRSAGYDSDGSSSSSHDRSSSRQRSHSQKASIFSRLGLSNPESFEDGGNEDMEGVEAENVEKSLLERVGITSPRVAHLLPDVNAVLYPRAFTSQDEDMKADSPRSENDIIVGAKGDSESSVRSGPIDKPTTPDHQWKTTLTDKVPNNTAQRDDGSERQSIHGPSRDTGQTTGRVSHVPPAPSATPPSPTTVENKNPVPHPNTSNNPDTANLGTSRRSASEEGELSEPLYANGVRGLLAPLVLQNAGGRSSKTAAEPLSPGELPQILTSDDVSSFGGTMSNLGKELLAQAGRDTKGGSGSFSAPNDTLPSAPRAMRNASWEHLPPSASSSTFADRKHDTAQSPFAISEAGLRRHDTILSPASGRYLPSLRYTPSPQRPELRHHESHSSTSRHPRSPSPTASIRRSSSTRDRPYDPYSHERLPHDTSLAAAPMADPSMHRPARRVSPPVSLDYGKPSSSQPVSESSFRTDRQDQRSSLGSPRHDKGRQYDDRRRPSYNKTTRRRDDSTDRGRTRRLDDEGSRRSASPAPRRPYKPYATGRRRSRSHSRSRSRSRSCSRPHSRTPSPQQPHHRHPKKQPPRGVNSSPVSRRRAYSYEQKQRNEYSMSKSQSPHGKHTSSLERTGYDTHDAYMQDSGDQFQSQYSIPADEGEGEQAPQWNLPCHNVPGLWFAKLGLPEIGIMECEFEVDVETASKWGLSRENVSSDSADHKSNKKLSLEIHCISKRLVEFTMSNVKPGATPKDVAEALYAAEKHWPPQGDLIIHVNHGNSKGKTILPDKLGMPCHPIQIAQHVHKGHNIVQFIQLRGMSESMFTLFAKERADKTYPTDSILYRPEPDAEEQANSSTGVIPIKPAIISISSIDE